MRPRIREVEQRPEPQEDGAPRVRPADPPPSARLIKRLWALRRGQARRQAPLLQHRPHWVDDQLCWFSRWPATGELMLPWPALDPVDRVLLRLVHRDMRGSFEEPVEWGRLRAWTRNWQAISDPDLIHALRGTLAEHLTQPPSWARLSAHWTGFDWGAPDAPEVTERAERQALEQRVIQGRVERETRSLAALIQPLSDLYWARQGQAPRDWPGDTSSRAHRAWTEAEFERLVGPELLNLAPEAVPSALLDPGHVRPLKLEARVARLRAHELLPTRGRLSIGRALPAATLMAAPEAQWRVLPLVPERLVTTTAPGRLTLWRGRPAPGQAGPPTEVASMMLRAHEVKWCYALDAEEIACLLDELCLSAESALGELGLPGLALRHPTLGLLIPTQVRLVPRLGWARLERPARHVLRPRDVKTVVLSGTARPLQSHGLNIKEPAFGTLTLDPGDPAHVREALSAREERRGPMVTWETVTCLDRRTWRLIASGRLGLGEVKLSHQRLAPHQVVIDHAELLQMVRSSPKEAGAGNEVRVRLRGRL